MASQGSTPLGVRIHPNLWGLDGLRWKLGLSPTKENDWGLFLGL